MGLSIAFLMGLSLNLMDIRTPKLSFANDTYTLEQVEINLCKATIRHHEVQSSSSSQY